MTLLSRYAVDSSTITAEQHGKYNCRMCSWQFLHRQTSVSMLGQKPPSESGGDDFGGRHLGGLFKSCATGERQVVRIVLEKLCLD
jgi:hypothetical protein